MVLNEVKKILKSPFVWGILFFAVILNVVMLIYVHKESYSGNDYKQLWEKYLVSKHSVTQEIDRIKTERKNTDEFDLESKKELNERVLKELEGIQSYNKYRKDILTNASKRLILSAFSDDGFARKNMEKTANHFKQMKTIELKAGPSLGVVKFFSPITAALIIIFLMFLGYLLFIQEEENGIRDLLRVTYYGKTKLFFSKIVAHMICMVAVTILMYGCNFFVLSKQYGFGDLGRSIQSILEYRSCGNILSVGNFLLIGVAIMGFILATLTILIDFICVWGNKTIVSILLLFLYIVVNVVLYIQIPFNSSYGWLKYLNPIFCLDAGEIVGKYVNLNFFGTPINYPVMIGLGYATMAIICFVLALKCYCKNFINEKTGYFYVRKRKRNMLPICSHMSLFRYEMFKVRKGGHITVVLIVFLLLSILFSYKDRLLFEDEDEYYYYSYIKQIQGEITEEKSKYIQQENERLQKVKDKQQKYLSEGEEDAALLLGESLRPYQGLQRVIQRENYLKKNGFNSFIYEDGYVRLIDIKENKENQILLLLGMIILTFSLCSVFAMDKETGQEQLLRTTYWGKKKRNYKKIGCSAVLCLCTFLIVYMPQLCTFYRLYGFFGLGEPVGCLQLEGQLFLRLPIFAWLIIQYAFRFLVLSVFSSVVLIVSSKLKNTFVTIITMSLCIMIIGVIVCC